MQRKGGDRERSASVEEKNGFIFALICDRRVYVQALCKLNKEFNEDGNGMRDANVRRMSDNQSSM